jgi:hypothetical protein
MSRILCLMVLLLAIGVVPADDTRDPEGVDGDAETGQRDDAPEAEEPDGDTEAGEPENKGAKFVDGMSILGNQEAPKALVIVPWKSSQLGESLGISTMLDDSRQPVDREVFMRALSYYEIRSESTP